MTLTFPFAAILFGHLLIKILGVFKQSLIAFDTSHFELTLVCAAVVYFNLGSMSSMFPPLHFLKVSWTGWPGTFETHILSPDMSV